MYEIEHDLYFVLNYNAEIAIQQQMSRTKYFTLRDYLY